MQNGTVIKLVTPDAEYRNLVAHQCSCGEFLKDIRREIVEFMKGKAESELKSVSKTDVFWHLSEYCDKKYGPCHWQQLSIDSLLLRVR